MGPSTPSAHRAVRVVFQSGCPPPPRPRLSRSTAAATEYQDILNNMLTDYAHIRPRTQWATLEVLIATGHRAAKAARPLLAAKEDSEPRTPAQLLLSALRLRRDGREQAAVALIADVPQLRACWSGDALRLSVMHHKIQYFMEESCLRDLAALEKPEVPDLHKTAKRNKIRRTAGAHRLQRRRMILDGLYDEDGRLVETAEEAGELLQAHWAPIFAGAPRSAVAQRDFLSHAVELPPHQDFEWPLGRTAEIARRLPDSTPGPDGLSYAFWGHLPEPWSDFVDSVALDMTPGSRLPRPCWHRTQPTSRKRSIGATPTDLQHVVRPNFGP